MKKLIITILSAGLALTTLTGCSETPNMGMTYQSGDGTVTEFQAMTRPTPVRWGGIANDGLPISSENLSGVITVLNFWYAACVACRVETPDLVALEKEFAGKAQFVGVNVRDSAETANAFKRNFNVNFPSVMDASTGQVVLAFTGIVTPSAVPTTLVIDRSGRVSARILGVADKETLRALIKTVYDEAMAD